MPTVLITGANRGLGLEFTRQYAADGWRVIATCRTPEHAKEIHALQPGVILHGLDVVDFAAVAALGRQLEAETIDVLIANAGVLLGGETLPSAIEPDAWIQSFQVNTMAPLACAGAFLAQVARSRERKLVAMSSWLGSIGANVTGGYYAYRSSKAALNALWRSLALDHPEVIAALMSPGRVRTEMTRYDGPGWNELPSPAERASNLRRVIAGLTQADSGGFFHYTGETLCW